jgi:hypothetical protein
MPTVGFEPTISMLDWAKTVLALDLGSPNFFSLRATLTPPLSPKGQALASSSYQHTVVLNYAQIFVLGLAGE